MKSHLLNDEAILHFIAPGILRNQNKCRAAYLRTNFGRCKKVDSRGKPGQ